MSPDHTAKVLADAIFFAKTETEADRAIVIYEGIGRCHGFAETQISWKDAPISTEMLSRFMAQGEPALVRDSMSDPEFGGRTSTFLSELGSVLFVPLRNEFGYCRGFLYLDQVGRSTFLASGFFDRVKRYVSDTMEPALHSEKEPYTWEELQAVEWRD